MIDKNSIRVLVHEVGYNEAAKRLNIKPATIRQWAHRGKWSLPARTDQRVTVVTRHPATIHSDILKEHERETKLSLAKSVRRMAKDAESVSLREAPYVHKVAQTFAIVHPQESNSNAILNVGVLIGTVPQPNKSNSPAIDI